MELKLIEGEQPEADINDENLAVAAELVVWAEHRLSTRGDCAAICSSMLGQTVRAMAYLDVDADVWRACLNPFITSVKGDMYTVYRAVLSFPKKKVKFDVHPECEFSYIDTEGNQQEKSVRGELAVIVQGMCWFLDGKPLDVVERDHMTVRRTEPKRRPNDRCVGCGRKVKRCQCERTRDECATTGLDQSPGLEQMPPLWGEVQPPPKDETTSAVYGEDTGDNQVETPL